MIQKACPECSSTNLKTDSERGETICQCCGLVVEDHMIDFGKEWRSYDEDGKEKVARAGPPLTYTQPDTGIRTQIGNYNDLKKVKQKDKFLRMMKWQYRDNTSEKNLRIALTQLKQVSSFLKLPGFVEEEAARIYTTVAQKGLIKGRDIEQLMLAALYTSCKEYNTPKTLKELTEASGCKKKDILKNHRIILRNLSLKSPPVEPTIFIARFANELKITPQTESTALEILEKAKEKNLLDGKSPVGMTAASLYIASLMNKEKRTQKQVAKLANITEVTVRQRYTELVKELNLQVRTKGEK